MVLKPLITCAFMIGTDPNNTRKSKRVNFDFMTFFLGVLQSAIEDFRGFSEIRDPLRKLYVGKISALVNA